MIRGVQYRGRHNSIFLAKNKYFTLVEIPLSHLLPKAPRGPYSCMLNFPKPNVERNEIIKDINTTDQYTAITGLKKPKQVSSTAKPVVAHACVRLRVLLPIPSVLRGACTFDCFFTSPFLGRPGPLFFSTVPFPLASASSLLTGSSPSSVFRFFSGGSSTGSVGEAGLSPSVCSVSNFSSSTLASSMSRLSPADLFSSLSAGSSSLPLPFTLAAGASDS